jgi:hypothetical protein
LDLILGIVGFSYHAALLSNPPRATNLNQGNALDAVPSRMRRQVPVELVYAAIGYDNIVGRPPLAA